MKIVAVSDLHGTLPEIPSCDLLLLGGDLCPVQDHRLTHQAEWLDTTFRYWLLDLPVRKIVAVAGNHDFIFEQAPTWVPYDLPWAYLQDSGIEWEGVHIWGSPWQPWFFNWAFNLYEPELSAKWNKIPENTDILVLHGPPFQYGDTAQPGTSHETHTGSPSLTERIRTIQPRLAIFGHIHEGRGQWQLGNTILANVSILDEKYRHVHPPWMCDLDFSSPIQSS